MTLPFPALVALSTAQQALLLLAVEPRLGGLILAAPAGTGKSSLARSARPLFGAPSLPYVELPLSADEESLMGGLDLEATLHSGRRVVRPGALARAHGGIIYVDGINLLPDPATNLLLSALDSGEVRFEREGMSLRTPAAFSLLASYDPAEGTPRHHLLDRVALLALLPGATNEQQRAEVVRRNLQPPLNEWQEEIELLQSLVRAARDQLASVTISNEQLEQLSATALLYGVQGHRVDLFAARTACASAALALRDEVDESDLEVAARLVILPRATHIPTPPADSSPAPEPQPPSDAPDSSEEQDSPPTLPAEQLLSALAADLPLELTDLPFAPLQRGRTGSRGATRGKRGRHIRSIPGDPRHARIDISATLRAAAPWQPIRARSSKERQTFNLHSSDLRIKQFRSKASTLFCFAVDASGSMALHRMRQAKGAVHALLQQAYVHRDRVALLAFRGDHADLLLPPSQSVELARRALDLLPTGGGTPLAAALLLALDIAKQARSRGILQTVLVLLTDGRANVGLKGQGESIKEELQHLGRHIAGAGIRAIVVDTQRSYLSRGEARKLAEWVGGSYAYLPNASGNQIAGLAMASKGDY